MRMMTVKWFWRHLILGHLVFCSVCIQENSSETASKFTGPPSGTFQNRFERSEANHHDQNQVQISKSNAVNRHGWFTDLPKTWHGRPPEKDRNKTHEIILHQAAQETGQSEAHDPTSVDVDKALYLGCRIERPDALLSAAVFSSLSDSTDGCCSCLCRQQLALVAASSASWCFCLNQLTAIHNLSDSCAEQLPSAVESGGSELLHFHWLPEQRPPALDPGGTPETALSASLRNAVDDIYLKSLRCVGTDKASGVVLYLDDCVHTCVQDRKLFIALGLPSSSSGVSPYVRCVCDAEDSFGNALAADGCDHSCWRDGQYMDMKCGGFGALSVYHVEGTGESTLSSEGTGTWYTSDHSCNSDILCPDRGVRVDNSCYLPVKVGTANEPVTFDQAVAQCESLGTGGWRVWAVETETEFESVYNDFIYHHCLDGNPVVTSGYVNKTETIWTGWPESGQVGAWLLSQLPSLPSEGDVIVLKWTNRPYQARVLDYQPRSSLSSVSFVVCEFSLREPTTSPATTSTSPSSSVTSSTEPPSTTHPTSPPTSSTSSPTSSTTLLPTTSTTVSSTSSSSTSNPSSTTTPTHAPPSTSTTPCNASCPSRSTTVPADSTSSPRPTSAPPSSSTSTSVAPDPGTKTPDDDINDIIDILKNVTDDAITDDDVKQVVDDMDTILDKQRDLDRDLASDRQFTIDMMRLVDTVLTPTAAWQNMTEADLRDTSGRLLASAESAGFLLAESTALAGTDEVIETTQGQVTLSASSVVQSISNHSFRFPSSSLVNTWIELPEGYHHLVPAGPGGRVQKVGMIYNSASMSILLSARNKSVATPQKELNSAVLSFSLGGAVRVKFPGQMAALHLNYRLPARDPPRRDVWRRLHPGEEPAVVPETARCAYWHTASMQWRLDGCHLVVQGRTEASCQCDHLTSFAILMDYHDYVGTPMALSILTLVLGGCSIICLIITWIVFTFNKWLQCRRTTITRNLCAVYAAALLLLLTVVDRKLVYLEEDVCTVVGAAAHFCFLCVFSWSLVEGVHLYKVLRHVFEPKTNSMIRYYLFAYLTPALIVLATNVTAIVTDQDAYIQDEFCWLTSPYFIWFFNGPVACVLVVNILIMWMAFRSASSLQVNQLRTRTMKVRRWLKGWLSLSCMLSVQWIVGYVYVDGSNVFDYVFTALNCSQGVLIFVFHCLLRTRTRQILLGRSVTTSKASMMMNSIYGQITLAQYKERKERQMSRLSRDTSITTLSSGGPRSNKGDAITPDSSPASERSLSSESSVSSCSRDRLLRRVGSGRAGVLSGRAGAAAAHEQSAGTQLRGRINLGFQADEPLPGISEESEHSSPQHSAASRQNSLQQVHVPTPAPGQQRHLGSIQRRQPAVARTNSSDMYR